MVAVVPCVHPAGNPGVFLPQTCTHTAAAWGDTSGDIQRKKEQTDISDKHDGLRLELSLNWATPLNPVVLKASNNSSAVDPRFHSSQQELVLEVCFDGRS